MLPRARSLLAAEAVLQRSLGNRRCLFSTAHPQPAKAPRVDSEVLPTDLAIRARCRGLRPVSDPRNRALAPSVGGMDGPPARLLQRFGTGGPKLACLEARCRANLGRCVRARGS